jgi:hypothetical protein
MFLCGERRKKGTVGCLPSDRRGPFRKVPNGVQKDVTNGHSTYNQDNKPTKQTPNEVASSRENQDQHLGSSRSFFLSLKVILEYLKHFSNFFLTKRCLFC